MKDVQVSDTETAYQITCEVLYYVMYSFRGNEISEFTYRARMYGRTFGIAFRSSRKSEFQSSPEPPGVLYVYCMIVPAHSTHVHVLLITGLALNVWL